MECLIRLKALLNHSTEADFPLLVEVWSSQWADSPYTFFSTLRRPFTMFTAISIKVHLGLTTLLDDAGPTVKYPVLFLVAISKIKS